MKEVAISIIIPVYNRAHYFESCITSAINQSFRDFEIIVGDDCSPNAAFEVIKSTVEKLRKNVRGGVR